MSSSGERHACSSHSRYSGTRMFTLISGVEELFGESMDLHRFMEDGRDRLPERQTAIVRTMEIDRMFRLTKLNTFHFSS